MAEFPRPTDREPPANRLSPDPWPPPSPTNSSLPGAAPPSRGRWPPAASKKSPARRPRRKRSRPRLDPKRLPASSSDSVGGKKPQGAAPIPNHPIPLPRANKRHGPQHLTACSRSLIEDQRTLFPQPFERGADARQWAAKIHPGCPQNSWAGCAMYTVWFRGQKPVLQLSKNGRRRAGRGADDLAERGSVNELSRPPLHLPPAPMLGNLGNARFFLPAPQPGDS